MESIHVIHGFPTRPCSLYVEAINVRITLACWSIMSDQNSLQKHAPPIIVCHVLHGRIGSTWFVCRKEEGEIRFTRRQEISKSYSLHSHWVLIPPSCMTSFSMYPSRMEAWKCCASAPTKVHTHTHRLWAVSALGFVVWNSFRPSQR